MQRICLVTGASRGIGAAIADLLAGQGHRVVGSATTAEGAGRISERFAAAGVAGRGVVLDEASLAVVEAVMEDILGQEGAPLVLVNNAGVTGDNILMRMLTTRPACVRWP